MKVQRVAVAAGAVAVLALGAGVAGAVIPDADGMAHACYDKNGNVRVVDEGVACGKGWTALDLVSQAQMPRRYTRLGEFVTVNPNSSGSARVLCDAGDGAMGGGYIINGVVGTDVINSYLGNQNPNESGWTVLVFNPTAGINTVAAQVTCLDFTP